MGVSTLSTECAAEQTRPNFKGYSPLPAWALSHLETFPFNVFMSDEAAQRVVLYRSKNYEIKSDERESLKKHTDRGYYVQNIEEIAYAIAMETIFETLLERKDIHPARKMELLQTAAAIKLRAAYVLVHSDEAIALSFTLGEKISSFLGKNDVLVGDLLELYNHDPDTLTHVVNVSSYAVLLAKAAGIKTEEELTELCIGAMLHDLGKRRIPHAILNSKQKLTYDERKIVRQHPQAAYEELQPRKEISKAQLMIAYQHHERLDGKGYPVGLIGEEIHPWAKICAVVDVFEALTGKRNYRSPVCIAEACTKLSAAAGKSLDPELVRLWIELVHKKNKD